MQTRGVSSQLAQSAPKENPESLAEVSKFLYIVLELVLVAGSAYLFDLEGRRHFFPVLCLTFGGFVVHTWLPFRFRLPFFALLSVASVLFVLGLTNGVWVIAAGGALIGICHLPVSFTARALLLVIAAGVLVPLRVWHPLPFWPVLGSMFMFRLVLYLHDNRRTNVRPPLASSVSYCFLLPNACFPLFPVVDYATFRETYYNEEACAIYQRGVTWIVRGMSHLLLYRFIKTWLVPAPYELRDVESLALFLATNYALYLYVSGLFHLVTGMLHLFGFNLPRTHQLYFLASSCSDVWRRINIYWKDFMLKMFFLPAFFALRRRGMGASLSIGIAVFVVFLGTWLLHSWQTFWLLGEFPVTVHDARLWLCVGGCMAVNSLRDYRRAAERPAASTEQATTLWGAFNLSARIVAMFLAVSLFWASWTNPGFFVLARRLLADSPGTTHGALVIVVWLLAAVFLGFVFLFAAPRIRAGRLLPKSLTFPESVALHTVALSALVAVGLPQFGLLLGPNVAGQIARFQSDEYIQNDPFAQMHGYYEGLNTAVVQAGPLLQSLTQKEKLKQQLGEEFEALTRPADPLLELELIPGWEGTLDGSRISINQFGMRDRKTITLEKPADRIRIAFVGSSVVMGYGVEDDEVLSRLFETRLNKEYATPSVRYEVLNFGIGKYWAIQRRVLIDRKVLAFEPNAIYYFAHQDELQGPVVQLAKLVAHGQSLPYEYLKEIVKGAGITRNMSWGAIEARLQPFTLKIVEETYRSIVTECRRRGIRPVWIYLPMPGVPDAPDLSSVLIPVAERAGFVVLDLSDWWGGRDPAELKRLRDDHHVDARGHRLIAQQLFDAVEKHADALPRLPGP